MCYFVNKWIYHINASLLCYEDVFKKTEKENGTDKGGLEK